MTTGNTVTTTQLGSDTARRRKAWLSVAAIGIAVGGLALAAPEADAAVQGIAVAPGPSFATSAQHGSGCTYKVTIDADINKGPIYFWDSAPATFGQLSPVPAANSVSVMWTPLGTGPHKITAWQSGGVDKSTVQFDVAVGHDFGSSCWALPF